MDPNNIINTTLYVMSFLLKIHFLISTSFFFSRARTLFWWRTSLLAAATFIPSMHPQHMHFIATDERDAIQKKTFTKWVNKHLKKVIWLLSSSFVNDIISSLLLFVRFPVRLSLFWIRKRQRRKHLENCCQWKNWRIMRITKMCMQNQHIIFDDRF